MMEQVTLIDLVFDFGLLSLLLLIGVWLRSKVKVLQKMFLPAGLIAGALALAFGPNGFGILPFSDAIASYPAIFLALVFAAIPLGAAKVSFKKASKRIRNMWIYCAFTFLAVYGVGLLFADVLLRPLFSTPEGFGFMLGVGFIGGHGGAAALGHSFQELGWADATSLGYASATVGMLVAIIGGMMIIKRGTEQRHGTFVTDYKSLPNELRTGLIERDNRKSLGEITFSPNSVDPLLVHIAFLGGILLISYVLQQFVTVIFPTVSIQLFIFTLLVGLLVQVFLRKSNADQYVDKRTVDRISGTSADLIVIFGIASINLAVVGAYAIPLAILLIFGIAFMYFCYRLLAPRAFEDHWFENAVFNWGWTTGTTGLGITLLRIVDPEVKTTTLQDYGIAYLGIIPFEILTIAIAPVFIVMGYGWVYIIGALAFSSVLMFMAFSRGWFYRESKQPILSKG
ncbi:sodium/glutamate symporter [Geomicrobium sediminis]|uniref:ESS family glutamate:Na+ symporter n=1 Tax=Geomicrobium sediminis TaxID=1347788 RepID=A0ABS2PEG7_9BACL|nr:sodium/glutamate symporter [Geomicrobium sediminis]MBM7633366.1 ESS family glutamate:Na+ symporter [Geomicrobium sediminis]